VLKLHGRDHHEHDLAETISAHADGRAPLVEAGTTVRVDSLRSMRNWRARVTYVSGEIVGLRGPMGANDVFSPRDLVTLHVRSDEIVFESHARVLATAGHTMRILTERGLVAAERHAAPRIHASPFVMLTPLDGAARTPQAAQLIDLSVLGCAIRCDRRLEIGSHVALAARGRHGTVTTAGEIVRVWRAEPTAWFHAGIQFDPMPAAEQGALQRLLVECIRGCDRAR
jgi:hypothetical protein